MTLRSDTTGHTTADETGAIDASSAWCGTGRERLDLARRLLRGSVGTCIVLSCAFSMGSCGAAPALSPAASTASQVAPRRRTPPQPERCVVEPVVVEAVVVEAPTCG